MLNAVQHLARPVRLVMQTERARCCTAFSMTFFLIRQQDYQSIFSLFRKAAMPRRQSSEARAAALRSAA